jgi:hypothetical protein
MYELFRTDFLKVIRLVLAQRTFSTVCKNGQLCPWISR